MLFTSTSAGFSVPRCRFVVLSVLLGYLAICVRIDSKYAVHAFNIQPWGNMEQCQPRLSLCIIRMSSDWSTFKPLDDDDDDEIVLGRKIDRRVYAVENDDPEVKAAVGAMLEAPEILHDADPISVPAGSRLDFDEETVLGLLSACRGELGTLFGYSEENRGVGITGSVEFVEIDAGNVVLSLGGRFWHQRTTVLDRVANYLQQRIPEIIEVVVEDPYQLTDEANSEAA